jgi:hypothetical protein
VNASLPAEEVLRLLRSDNADIRRRAVSCGGKLRDHVAPEGRAEVVAALFHAILSDPDPGVRESGVWTLGEEEPFDPAPLRQLLADEAAPPMLRLVAAQVLLRHGEDGPSVEYLVGLLAGTDNRLGGQAVSGLEASGPAAQAALPALRDAYERETRDGRQAGLLRAIAEVGRGDPGTVSFLREQLRAAGDSRARIEVGTALIRAGERDEGYRTLTALLDDADPDTRMSVMGAARGLMQSSRHREPASAEFTLRAVRDASPEVRAAAWEMTGFLRQMPAPPAELVAALLDETDEAAWERGCWALASSADTTSVWRAAVARLDGASEATRERLVGLLARVATDLPRDERASAVPVLVGVLSTPSAYTRAAAALALADVAEPGDETAIRALTPLSGDTTVVDSEAGGPTVGEVVTRCLVKLGVDLEVPPEALADRKLSTISNSRQLATAALCCAQDWDEVLPGAAWPWTIQPYVPNLAILRSQGAPSLSVGFAMNEAVAGRTLGEIVYPAETILFFEAAGASAKPTGGADRVADWWGDGTVCVSFVDSHAKWVTVGEARRMLAPGR